MKLQLHSPAKSLNQAYRKEHIEVKEFEQFRIALEKLLAEMENQEENSLKEENIKNLMSIFLSDAYYKNLHAINTKHAIDNVIHHQDTQKSNVGVMIETKKPTSNEFISKDNFNKKSFHQLIYYYLLERIEEKNTDVKNLIITNVYEWFIFDENQFDKLFYQDKNLIKKFTDFQRSKKSTSHFYKEIAQPFIENSDEEITCTYFDLREYKKELESFKVNFEKEEKDEKTQQEERKLIHLYKILSPIHLLKKPFANDSNSLNKDFYNELLHILGLEEVKEQGKKIIKRKNKKEREAGSFLENTLSKLDGKPSDRIRNYKSYGGNDTERVENIALELSITWTNRILFLKLMEAQLLQYHKNDKKEIRQKYKFLTTQSIENFNVLDDLFFRVLAKKPKDRNEFLNRFLHIPYLNSSLFEETLLESSAVSVSSLHDTVQLSLYSKTVLKDANGNKRSGKETPLNYFFQFLDAYNFSSEGTEEIRKDKKTLINASVLGLIFEKINGYKDGSFYTPSFITMYMCRQIIRPAVIQKFSEAYKKEFRDIEDVEDFLIDQRTNEERLKNNKIFDSIKICDPAVGSGHFLVSVLNELISIKQELRILADQNGKRLPIYTKIENDELIILQNAETIFDYTISEPESQRIQKTLFLEKQNLIENCLFGVDINPNSVKICRLRLWIELLKNAYYTEESNYKELETLPNIDINIKTGNSLISRFDLDADISKALKKSKWSIDSYRVAVQTYRNATNRVQKYEMEQLIETIKADFSSEVSKKDPKVLALSKKTAELQILLTQTSVFELSKTEEKTKQKTIEKLEKEVLELNQEIEDIKSNKIYQNAFEWRFEFPEVLDKNGNFIGFDVVIGNPPYGIKLSPMEKEVLSAKYKWDKSNNSASYFIGLAMEIGQKNLFHSYIVPKQMTYSLNWSGTREFILNYNLECLIDTSEAFNEVELETVIYALSTKKQLEYTSGYVIDETVIENASNFEGLTSARLLMWINEKNQSIATKYLTTTEPLEKIAKVNWGGNVVKYALKSCETEDCLKLYRGKDLSRYYVRENKITYIKKENIDVSFYVQGEKLLFQRIFSRYGEKLVGNFRKARFVGTYVNDHEYVDKTVTMIWESKYDLKYLLAILNSKLSSWFAHIYLYNRAQLTMEFMYKYAREFPIKIVSEQEQKPFIHLVNQILTLKKENPSADTSQLENQIDDLVYNLYGLNEEEIKIING